jgi:type IV pilus biogenesis protein CpaD/CtpE
MRFWFIALVVWSSSIVAAHAQGCTQKIVEQLRQRGFDQQVIAAMCNPSNPSTAATVCVTRLGACPSEGPPDSPCTCVGQFGTVSGEAK